jgi:regulator of telomere elongation helicase 1
LIEEDIANRSELILVEDIHVYFPFKPYPDQVKYIESVIHALNNRQNALLESPTGTGKTLCLLVSTIAWLAHQRNKDKLRGAYSDGTTKEPIKIIYTSRTHSQLKQVVHELKSTCYKPVASVVGSRDQTCINDELRSIKGRGKNIKCVELVQKNKCQYFNKQDRTNVTNLRNRIVEKKEILDIEELTQKGSDCNVCPYFTMKMLNDQADVLIMPYNYLTDKNIRDNYASKLKNSILIFDEAHNIEKAAEEGSSVNISSGDLLAGLKELDQIQKSIRESIAEVHMQNERKL